MNRTTLLVAAVAALVAATGAAAAAGSTATTDSTASMGSGADAAAQAGPPDDLPGPVPEFVSEIHGAIRGFVDGAIDALGPVVSGVADNADGDGAADAESFPTETPAAGESGGGDGADASGGDATSASDAGPDATDGTASTPRFGFAIDTVERCGQTCRDVTSTLTNAQDTDAADVTVHTRIFVGQGTDGDVVWRGTEDVGALGAGESYTTTRQVELSFADALAVQNAGGWITVQTSVETADRTVTVTDERQVA